MPRNATPRLSPGTIADRSGIYGIVGPRGGYRGERTVPAGHTLPPTDIPGCHYILDTPADNREGRGTDKQ